MQPCRCGVSFASLRPQEGEKLAGLRNRCLLRVPIVGELPTVLDFSFFRVFFLPHRCFLPLRFFPQPGRKTPQGYKNSPRYEPLWATMATCTLPQGKGTLSSRALSHPNTTLCPDAPTLGRALPQAVPHCMSSVGDPSSLFGCWPH